MPLKSSGGGQVSQNSPALCVTLPLGYHSRYLRFTHHELNIKMVCQVLAWSLGMENPSRQALELPPATTSASPSLSGPWAYGFGISKTSREAAKPGREEGRGWADRLALACRKAWLGSTLSYLVLLLILCHQWSLWKQNEIGAVRKVPSPDKQLLKAVLYSVKREISILKSGQTFN